MDTAAKPGTLQMIADFSNAKAPSGFEEETIAAARKHIGCGYETEEDCLRNFYMYRKANTGKKPVFMLDAHSDEVGFMVHSIRPNGTLRFVALGGWNVSALPSTKVLVRNKHGQYIPGIIAAKPVHFMTEAEKHSSNTEISALSIDIGALDAEDAVKNFGIRIGEPIVPDVTMEYDETHDLLFGKAFDCRIGCAAMLEALHRLENEELDVDVVGVLSSQEEVGERGMKVAVGHAKPDIAICFEGCPADDTFTPADEVGAALGKGPMFRYFDVCMITNPRYQRFVLGVAAERGLPAQTSVREGGGTNGGVVHQLDIPSVVAGIPCRYIHAGTSVCAPADIVSAAEIAVAVAERMTPEVLASF